MQLLKTPPMLKRVSAALASSSKFCGFYCMVETASEQCWWYCRRSWLSRRRRGRASTTWWATSWQQRRRRPTMRRARARCTPPCPSCARSWAWTQHQSVSLQLQTEPQHHNVVLLASRQGSSPAAARSGPEPPVPAHGVGDVKPTQQSQRCCPAGPSKYDPAPDLLGVSPAAPTGRSKYDLFSWLRTRSLGSGSGTQVPRQHAEPHALAQLACPASRPAL